MMRMGGMTSSDAPDQASSDQKGTMARFFKDVDMVKNGISKLKKLPLMFLC